jgi:hypothetical protein
MKRWLAIVLCVLFAVSTLSLVACQKQETASESGGYGSNEEASGYGGGEEAAGGYGGGEEAGGYGGGGEEAAGGYGN